VGRKIYLLGCVTKGSLAQRNENRGKNVSPENLLPDKPQEMEREMGALATFVGEHVDKDSFNTLFRI